MTNRELDLIKLCAKDDDSFEILTDLFSMYKQQNKIDSSFLFQSDERSNQIILMMVENFPFPAIYFKNQELYPNQKAIELLSYPKEILQNLESWFGALFRDNVEENKKIFFDEKAKDFPSEKIYKVTTGNNEEKFIEFRGQTYFYGEVIVLEDVSTKIQKENEYLFNSFSTNNISEIILWVDQNANIIFYNTPIINQLNYPENFLINKNIITIIPTFDIFKWKEIWKDSINKNLKIETELVNYNKSNSVYKLDIQYIEINNHEFVCIIAKDISEQRIQKHEFEEVQQLLNLVSENSSDMISILDSKNRFVFASKSFEKNLDYSSKEILVLNYLDIIHPEDLDNVTNSLNSDSNHYKLPNTISYRIKSKNDEFIWLDTIIKQEFDENDKCIRIILSSNLANNRIIAENKLKESEKMLSLIYNNVSDLIFLMQIEDDSKYKCISVNQSYLQSTGLHENQIINKYIEEILPHAAAQFVIQKYKEAKESKEVLKYFENVIIEGNKVVVETTLTPIFDNNSEVTHLLGVAKDISKYKYYEEMFNLSDNRLMSLQNNQDLIICSYSTLLDKLIYVNDKIESISLYPKAMFVNGSLIWDDLVHTNDKSIVATFRWNLNKNEKDTVIYRILDKNNKIKWIKENAWLVKDEQSNILRIDSTLQDISYIKQNEFVIKNEISKLNKILSITQESYICINSDLIIKESNLSFAKLLQKPLVSIIGSNLFDYFEKESANKFLLEIENLKNTNSKSFEINVISEFGITINCNIVCSLFFDSNMNENIIAFITNQTNHKEFASKIEENKNLYQTLIEASFDALIIHQNGKILDVNNAFVNFFEIEKHDVLGLSIFDFVDSKDIDFVKEKLKEKITGTFQIEAITHSNKKIQIEISAIEVKLDNKTVRVVALRDISKKLELEKKYQNNLNQIKLISENIPASIYQWIEYKDGTYKLDYISDNFEQIFHIPSSEIYNIEKYIHPDDIQSWRNSSKIALENNGNWNLEARFVYPDNSIKWWNGISKIVSSDENSTIYHGVLIDISDKKFYEKELIEIKNNYLDLYNHAPIGYHSFDENGLILNVNETETHILEYEKEEIINNYFYNFLDPNSKLKFGEHLHKLSFKDSSDVELIAITKNLKHIKIHLTSSIKNRDGSKFTTRSILTDVTHLRETQINLKQISKLLKSITHSSLDGIIALEAIRNENEIIDFRFIYSNPSAHHILKLNENIKNEELTIRSIDFFDKFEIYEHIKQVVLYQDWLVFEKSLELDDYTIWYKFAIVKLNDGVTITISDISEYKKIEKELNQLAIIASKTSNAIILTDKHGKVEWVNQAFTEICGYTFHDVIGKVPGEFLQGKNTSLETIYRMHENINKQIPFSEEILNYKKNGEEIWFKLTITPLFDSNGKIERYISIQIDISEQKKSQQELIDSYKQLNDLKFAIDSSAILAITDAEGTLTYVNQNFIDISGYHYEELIGKNPRFFNSGYHSKEFFADLWQTITCGNVWKGEICNKSKDGSLHWVDTTIVPFLDKNSTPFQYIVIRYDITDRKKAENEVREINTYLEEKIQERTKELLALNKEKDEILSIAAHDLRNPLTGIMLQADISKALIRRGNSNQAIVELSEIDITIKRMTEIISNLLDISKLESGKLLTKYEHFDLKEIMDIILSNYTNIALKKNIQIHFEENQQIKLNSDKDFVLRIIENLISNAIKYSNFSTNIFISNKEIELENVKYYQFSIKDQGPGFTDEDLTKIFGKFAKLSARPTANEISTGLGLSIVKKSIEMLNGKIEYKTKIGEGTEFVVLIPTNQI